MAFFTFVAVFAIVFAAASAEDKPDVRYELYRATAGKCPVEKGLDAERPSIVVIPSRKSSIQADWIQKSKTTILSWESFNLVLVDWSAAYGATPEAGANNARAVGAAVAEKLMKKKLKARDVQLVGHGIGAQIAAVAARILKEKTGETVARVTALDPYAASETAPISDRLDATDALFVDVLHTNTRKLGAKKPVGHVDWYANGGAVQPGCQGSQQQIDECSHSRAGNLFEEALIAKVLSDPVTVAYDGAGNPAFTKIPNGFRINYGEWTSLRARGVYTFETEGSAPYLISSF